MGKIFGIVGMAGAAFLGHWMYGEFKTSNCLDSVDDFRAQYQKHRGNPNRSDIVKLLKTAKQHCEAGEHDEAIRLLVTKANICSISNDC